MTWTFAVQIAAWVYLPVCLLLIEVTRLRAQRRYEKAQKLKKVVNGPYR